MSTAALIMFLTSLAMAICLVGDHAWLPPLILGIMAGAVYISDAIREGKP